MWGCSTVQSVKTRKSQEEVQGANSHLPDTCLTRTNYMQSPAAVLRRISRLGSGLRRFWTTALSYCTGCYAGDCTGYATMQVAAAKCR